MTLSLRYITGALPAGDRRGYHRARGDDVLHSVYFIVRQEASGPREETDAVLLGYGVGPLTVLDICVQLL